MWQVHKCKKTKKKKKLKLQSLISIFFMFYSFTVVITSDIFAAVFFNWGPYKFWVLKVKICFHTEFFYLKTSRKLDSFWYKSFNSSKFSLNSYSKQYFKCWFKLSSNFHTAVMFYNCQIIVWIWFMYVFIYLFICSFCHSESSN